MRILTINNSDIDFSKGMILNPPKMEEVTNFIDKNNIKLGEGPLLSFWKNKNIYLNFRIKYFDDHVLVNSADELNNIIKEYYFSVIDQIRAISFPDSYNSESNILNKLPISASSLYAKNVFNFVVNLYDKEIVQVLILKNRC